MRPPPIPIDRLQRPWKALPCCRPWASIGRPSISITTTSRRLLPPVCRRCSIPNLVTKRRKRTRLRLRASMRTRCEMLGCQAKCSPSFRALMPFLEEAATRIAGTCRKRSASHWRTQLCRGSRKNCVAVAPGCGLFAPDPRNRTGEALYESGEGKQCEYQDGTCVRRQVVRVKCANLCRFVKGVGE